MKRLFILGAINSLLVTMLSLSWAATNLNSSRSNIYRVIYDTESLQTASTAAATSAHWPVPSVLNPKLVT